MLRKTLLIFVFAILFCSGLNAQVTIFSEDFETATGAENDTNPAYIGWQGARFATTPPTNNNYFWVLDNTRCTVISGNHSLAVSQNSPATTGTLPQYDDNRAASTLVYYTTQIDATNYTNTTLDFNWYCEGESGASYNFDFGTVIYSLDGNTWAILPGEYLGQPTTQNVTNLDLSIIDGQQFYIGFAWKNDNSLAYFPSFVVDDIVIKATPLPVCTTPSQQPTTLNLSPTEDTVFGSFVAPTPTPTPDNYLVVISTSATPPTPTNGTTYNVGDTIGTGTVVDIDDNTSFTATGLTASTTYYIYIYSYNSVCIGGPLYNVTSPLSGNVTTTNTTYCTPLTLTNASVKYINDIQFIGTLNDVSNLNNSYSTSPSGYQDWTGLPKAVQAQGEGVNVYFGSSTGRGRWKAWVDWNKDGVFADPGEKVYDTGGVLTTTSTFGFVIPAAQTLGDYRIRIRVHNAYRNNGVELGSFNYSPCQNFGSGGPSANYGETEDYLFTVIENCTAKITSITNGETCGEGSVDLTVTGSVGVTEYNWYDAQIGGNLIATTTSSTWSPYTSETTTYWVTAVNGSCESLVRTKIVAIFKPITDLTITSATEVCGKDNIVQIDATGDFELAYLIDEDFEDGGLGVFTNNNIVTNQNAITGWQNQASPFVPSQQVWFPAISSGFGTNNFVMATSDVPFTTITHNALESGTVDSSDFTDLTLEFDMYFSRYLYTISIPEYVYIDVSTDGGTNWTTEQTYDNDVGYGTAFVHQTISLNNYIDETNLKVRIRYYANYWCDGVAVDNIQLYGDKPLSPSFTWSGTVDAYTDAAATIPYNAGTTAASVYIRPTLTQLQQAVFTFTANATLSNGCTISKDISIINKTKIWVGTVNNNWYDDNNWLPFGRPDANNCVVILDVSAGSTNKPILNYIDTGTIPIPPTVPGYAKNLTVNPNAFLDIQADSYLLVTDWVHIDGTINVRDTGSLIQITDGATNVNNNTGAGNMNMQRTVSSVNSYDYIYWSSPVESFGVTGVSPSSTYIYHWIPTIAGNGVGNYGNWQATTETMQNGKGYIIRNVIGTPTPLTPEFVGIPNNGVITKAITRGSYTSVDYTGGGTTMATALDDNWNLVGNPYPSAISALQFITVNAANISDDSTPVTSGAVYLWRHATAPSNVQGDPFYDDFVYNYNPNDYITYNASGGTPFGFNGDIAAGQAFFVLMEDSAPATGSSVTFNNSMRNVTLDNSQFYKTDQSTATLSDNAEKHRIWLDLISPNNTANVILVGYIENATNDQDRLFDAHELSETSTRFYSLINDDEMVIQGKALPFIDTDIVPLGIEIQENGNYSIAINNLDGLFIDASQFIYLEDTYNNIIHDLRINPYSFNAEVGIFNDRFILRYNDESLDVDEFNQNSGLEIVAPNNSFIKVTSGKSHINTVLIYDLLGRLLVEQNEINASEFSINNFYYSEGTYIVKATLVDGKQKTQKVILKH